ncbi:MAG: PilZ domain-containing protein [Candidatus Polarisedimenticolaceae bacterium]|nr:PilZ domain-containing protein [Candidatus Polarisedimenticolaceae bacterium]
MEHRFNQRKEMSLDVMINHQGLGLVNAQSTNISMGGMFIDTGRIRLPSNSAIKIFFTLDTECNNRTHDISAIVVRSTEHGVAIMFDGMSDHCNSALFSTIHGDSTASDSTDEPNSKICTF